ncbi:MAG: hypothetical protein ABSH04_08525 [Acidimicrobiales bacterium]
MLADEQSYAAMAVSEEARVAYVPEAGPGVYALTPRSDLMSASSTVVSALIPALRLFPGGNDGEGWLSTTIDVSSGKSIQILDLFEAPAAALRAIGTSAHAFVMAGNSCVRGEDLYLEQTRQPVPGFSPTGANYRYLALTRAGLAVGFPNGQLASPSCGRVEVTIPYKVIAPYLNKVGKSLVSGVRQPLG